MPGQTDHGEALRQAARVNDIDKLKELLEKGAEPNASYVRVCSLIHFAPLLLLFIPVQLLSCFALPLRVADRIHTIEMGQHVWAPRGSGSPPRGRCAR